MGPQPCSPCIYIYVHTKYVLRIVNPKPQTLVKPLARPEQKKAKGAFLRVLRISSPEFKLSFTRAEGSILEFRFNVFDAGFT